MRKLSTLFTLFLVSLLSFQVSAQTRYLDEVFSEVAVEEITYANNISVLTGSPAPVDLKADIYTPVGDTATNRWVMMMCHSGNFLPPIVNGAYNGTKNDSSITEMCKRFAKLGYVAISFEYRLGWNPVSPDQNVRTGTILNAAYRGLQDARTLVRFLRKSVAEQDNPYGINDAKIVVGGQGTGGYVSMGAAFLDDFNKIILPKFINFDSMPAQVYVDTLLVGNIEGTSVGAINIPNHVGYSSDFNMVFNLGGALGDSSWIDPGDMPAVGFHTPLDINAPYDIGDVKVPTTGDIVIGQASGSFSVSEISNRFGNNQIFTEAGFNDVFTQAADLHNEGNEGLFPFVRRPVAPGELYDCGFGVQLPAVDEGGPWDWWDQADFIATWDIATGGEPVPGAVANCSQLASNPDMSPEKGRTYIDSIMGYLAPRMNAVLLATSSGVSTSIDNTIKESVSFGAYPNPTNGILYIRSSEALRKITVYDIAGREVRVVDGIRGTGIDLERGDIQAGMYIIRADFDKASVTQKVMWQ
ncbi:MAG: T9SS type A sorting domain-containing protein [Bacteroidota bacterium]